MHINFKSILSFLSLLAKMRNVTKEKEASLVVKCLKFIFVFLNNFCSASCSSLYSSSSYFTSSSSCFVLALKVFCITLHFSFGQMIFSILAYGCLPQANFAMKFMQTFCQQYDKIDCKNMAKKRGKRARVRGRGKKQQKVTSGAFLWVAFSSSHFLYHFMLDSKPFTFNICVFMSLSNVSVCVCECVCISVCV